MVQGWLASQNSHVIWKSCPLEENHSSYTSLTSSLPTNLRKLSSYELAKRKTMPCYQRIKEQATIDTKGKYFELKLSKICKMLLSKNGARANLIWKHKRSATKYIYIYIFPYYFHVFKVRKEICGKKY